MTSKLTREQAEDTIEGLEELISRGLQSVYLDMALAGMRQLLAAMDSEPVAEVIQKLNGYDRPLYVVAIEGDVEEGDVLYRHAQPVVPNEITSASAPEVFEIAAEAERLGLRGTYASYAVGWNACRADMLQELQKSAGVSNNCRSNEKLQDQHVESLTTIKAAPALDSLPKNAESRSGNSLANDTNVVKRLTITLPDTSSKAFWSGTGKTETFHPVTYRRWVKEAIERYCAIARIDVEVK
ncbi:hypothetical protein SB6424_00078 [Klebsiella pasteurii]|nr:MULTISPECIES: hypothetical protein [Klebsiella]VUS56524.1 hypothetical protein SB6424_00078 [Klebsiella pasteurii]